MQRFTMSASDGSVVPIESKDGDWLKYGEVDYEMSTLRYEKEEALEATNDESVLNRVQAMGEESLSPETFEKLEYALEWLRKTRKIGKGSQIATLTASDELNAAALEAVKNERDDLTAENEHLKTIKHAEIALIAAENERLREAIDTILPMAMGMTTSEINKRFAELAGTEPDIVIKAAEGYERFYPDFAADPRLVLRVMQKRKDWQRFGKTCLMFASFADDEGEDYNFAIPIDLILGHTEKFLRMTIEFMERRAEHNVGRNQEMVNEVSDLKQTEGGGNEESHVPR